MSTTFTVPCVDLATDPPSAFTDALTESSCVFIVNHGVPAPLIDSMVEVSTAFFDLPRAAKLPTRWPGDGLWRGWQPVYEGAEDLTGGRLPDLLERFEVSMSGPRLETPSGLAALRDTFALWPSSPEPFARVWTEYYAALGNLANRQVGDLLVRWTNRVIRPNIHRVVNPPLEVAATSRRLSIPYFHYPRLDLVVAAAPSCVRADRRAPEHVVAGDHVFRRQEDYKDADIDGIEEALASSQL